MTLFSKMQSLTIFLLGCSLLATAQQTGRVEFPEYGVAFTIPDGWVGQVMGEAYLIGHQTQPGFFMLTPHDAQSVEEMRATASQGLNDPASGVALQLSGSLEDFGQNGVGGEFSGALSGQQVRSYLIGLLNPHGQGVMVMSAVSAPMWSDQYKRLTREIAGSIEFTKVTAPAVAAQGGTVAEWKYRLGNTKLTYMESYNSIDYSNPDITTGGGYSNKEVIDLCNQGFFNYYSRNSMSVTGGATVSGSASGSNRGAGTWNIREEGNGNKVLVLTFYSGEVSEYTLSYPDEKMHLNGYRYYHTWTGENAPDCN